MYTLTNLGEMPRTSEMPVLVTINGVPCWQSRSGRTFPLVAGAEDPPPAPQPEPPKPGDGDPDGGDEFDKDRAFATIKKLREGEKALKSQLKEMETLKADLKKRDDADKSETEKLAAKVAELTTSLAETQGALKATRIGRAIEQAAQKHHAHNPAVIARQIDQTKLELDDDGAPTNAEDLIKELAKAEPYLFGKAGDTNGSTSGVPATPKGGDPPAITDEERKKRAVGIRDIW